MAANPLPRTIDLLTALAEDAADGAAAHEGTIGLLQNTEARIRADLSALQTAEQSFQTARQTGLNLTTVQRVADSNAKAFIGTAKNVLEPVLGGQWTTAWAPTGFVTSLAIPSQIAERQSLLASLRDYFTANATHENAPLNITAAQATTLHTALSDARSGANAGLVDRNQKRAGRDAARRALEKRLAGLIGELDQLLEASDPIWLAFGLNMPDATVTPEAPSSVVLAQGGAGSVFADWDDVANADHYRVFKQEVGVDANFVVAGSPTDSDFLIAGVGDGSTLRVKVSAVSGSLEGPASAVVEIIVEGGGGPDPVTASGDWDQASDDALITWDESADPNLDHYEIRMSPGPTYNSSSATTIGSVQSGTSEFHTTDGLANSGDVASFKVFVALTNGNEAGSNTVTITRP